MSYYKVRNMRITETDIKLSVADSSISPLYYHTIHMADNIDDKVLTFDDKLKDICKNLCNGNLQPTTRCELNINLPEFQSKNDTNFIMMVIHQVYNKLDNLDLAYYYKLDKVENTVIDTIYDNFFKDWITKGAYNATQLKEAVKNLSENINNMIYVEKVRMEGNKEARVNSCGRCDGLYYDDKKQYLIGISDFDKKIYLFKEENYDKQSLGLIHNIKDAIELDYTEEERKDIFHNLTSLDYVIDNAYKKLDDKNTSNTTFEEIQKRIDVLNGLYTEIKGKTNDKELIDKLDDILDTLNELYKDIEETLNPLEQEDDEKEI